MNKQQMYSLSGVFAQLATGGTGTDIAINGIAPFTVQYGYVQEICKHDGVRVLDCPMTVLVKVLEWAKDQTPYVGVSIHDGALFVR